MPGKVIVQKQVLVQEKVLVLRIIGKTQWKNARKPRKALVQGQVFA